MFIGNSQRICSFWPNIIDVNILVTNLKNNVGNESNANCYLKSKNLVAKLSFLKFKGQLKILKYRFSRPKII